MVPFSRELYIERDDFMEDPPKKFFRLAPGREVRLRYGYFITCTEVVKDAAGRDRRAALHVRSGHARRRRARRPQSAGHHPLGVGARTRSTASCGCTTSCSRCPTPTTSPRGRISSRRSIPSRSSSCPARRSSRAWRRIRRERAISSSETAISSATRRFARRALVFNRTVTLRDSWAKMKDK